MFDSGSVCLWLATLAQVVGQLWLAKPCEVATMSLSATKPFSWTLHKQPQCCARITSSRSNGTQRVVGSGTQYHINPPACSLQLDPRHHTSYVQVPPDVLQLVSDKLSALNIRQFRLTCKSLHAALPVLQQDKVCLDIRWLWESIAAEIRRAFPQALIALCVEASTDITYLLSNPMCDIVSFAPRHNVMPLWSTRSSQKSVKIKDTAAYLTKVQAVMRDASHSKRVEAVLQANSQQLSVSDILVSAIRSVASRVTQMQVNGQLPDVLSHNFNLDNVTTLVFKFSTKSHQAEGVRTTLRQLPKLETVCIFVTGAHPQPIALELLEVLPGLPNISTLKLATDTPSIRLSAAQLQHITCLELGSKVHFDKVPAQLEKLCLVQLQQTLQHKHMLLQLQQSVPSVSLIVLAFEHASLVCLPVNLQSLTLNQVFETCQLSLVCSALSQLSQLRVLRIASFLHTALIQKFLALCLPLLHTFGFQSHYESAHASASKLSLYQTNHVYHEEEGVLVPSGSGQADGNQHRKILKPPCSVKLLDHCFPALSQLEVHFRTAVGFSTVGLDCAFMTQEQFPNLRRVTCYCHNTIVQLRSLPASCYSVIKYSELR